MTPKASFISAWETFQQMQYIDLCQLITAVESVEHLALKNLKINLSREDSKAGKIQNSKAGKIEKLPPSF